MRAALLATACLLLAALGWLVIAARPQPVTGGAAARDHTAAAAPSIDERPVPTRGPRPPPPALSDESGRDRFLASAEDKWQRLVAEAGIGPEPAARAWEVIRRYREAVYPQLLAASRQHERSPAGEVDYLHALYYGPAALAARRRALEELAEVMPPGSLGWVRDVEPSLFPEAEIAAARGRTGAPD